jgi:hypothetical protein
MRGRAAVALFTLLGCSPSAASPAGADAAAGSDASADGSCDASEPADAYAPAQGYECNESLQTIPTRSGVTLPFDLVTPTNGAPKGAVILLAGGNGALGLSATGIGQAADNFCVRTRQMYALAGFVAAVPDAPSDHAQGLDGFRASPEHAQDLSALVKWLRDRYAGLHVTVVGTSRGTISAVDVAARFGAPDGPDRVVLTSSVTVIPAGATDAEDIQSVPGYEAKLAARVPILMLDDTLDACGASPPDGARALAQSIGDTLYFRIVNGGAMPPTGANACGGTSYHGFYGQDPEVVGQIVQFIENGH